MLPALSVDIVEEMKNTTFVGGGRAVRLGRILGGIVIGEVNGVPSELTPVDVNTTGAGTIGTFAGTVTWVVKGIPLELVPVDGNEKGVVNAVGVETTRTLGGIVMKVVNGLPPELVPVDVKPATGTIVRPVGMVIRVVDGLPFELVPVDVKTVGVGGGDEGIPGGAGTPGESTAGATLGLLGCPGTVESVATGVEAEGSMMTGATVGLPEGPKIVLSTIFGVEDEGPIITGATIGVPEDSESVINATVGVENEGLTVTGVTRKLPEGAGIVVSTTSGTEGRTGGRLIGVVDTGTPATVPGVVRGGSAGRTVPAGVVLFMNDATELFRGRVVNDGVNVGNDELRLNRYVGDVVVSAMLVLLKGTVVTVTETPPGALTVVFRHCACLTFVPQVHCRVKPQLESRSPKVKQLQPAPGGSTGQLQGS